MAKGRGISQTIRRQHPIARDRAIAVLAAIVLMAFAMAAR